MVSKTVSEETLEDLPIRNGSPGETEQTPQPPSTSDHGDIDARLQAAELERETLRTEVTQLRKSLEEVQSKHDAELASATEERDEAQAAKEKADAQYQTLLGRVNTIRSQLGDRLKADAVRGLDMIGS